MCKMKEGETSLQTINRPPNSASGHYRFPNSHLCTCFGGAAGVEWGIEPRAFFPISLMPGHYLLSF